MAEKGSKISFNTREGRKVEFVSGKKGVPVKSNTPVEIQLATGQFS